MIEKGAEIRKAREELAGFWNTWFYSHEIDEIHAFAESASEEECCAELDRLYTVRDLRLADWRAGQ